MLRGIYIRIPKTGSTSIVSALADKVHILNVPRKWKKKKRLSGLALEAKQGYKFSFIRNPWDRMVSHWKMFQHFGRTKNTFPEHVESIRQRRCSWNVMWHACSQYDQLVHDGQLLVDFVGRFETLHKDFDHICDHLGIEAELPHLNSYPGKSYREYYDSKTWDAVGEIYQKDIEFFGYTAQ